MTDHVSMECRGGYIPDPGRPNAVERAEIARLSRRSDADIGHSVTEHDTPQQIGWGDGHWATTTDQFGRPIKEWIVHDLHSLAPTPKSRQTADDDSGINYNPETPTQDVHGWPYLVMCGDCYNSPVSENEDGYAGLFCEVCERRRARRGLD